MVRRASRKDANHDEMVQTMRRMGGFVVETYQLGDGFPDTLTVWFGRVIRLVEIKTEDGKLTEAEEEFFRNWPGPKIYIVRTHEDVYNMREELLAEEV